MFIGIAFKEDEKTKTQAYCTHIGSEYIDNNKCYSSCSFMTEIYYFNALGGVSRNFKNCYELDTNEDEEVVDIEDEPPEAPLESVAGSKRWVFCPQPSDSTELWVIKSLVRKSSLSSVVESIKCTKYKKNC